LYISQQLAANAVNQVLGGRNLTAALEDIFREHSNITPQQRAVAQDLSYGTLRFYGRLQGLLSQLLEKPLQDMRTQCLLLVALYQLSYDTAAQHAVVDQAVKAATELKKPWAKGLVNAVLRNFLRRSEALNQALAQDEVAKHSYPQWWINKLKNQYPQSWQSLLEAGNQHPPMTLRVNQRIISSNDYCLKLAEQGIAAQKMSNSAVMLAKPLPVSKLPGFYEGEVSVQDYGAQFAAELLDVADGLRVLDACCAPGGKTGHILELADVNMVALDNDAGRLQRVQANLDRLNLKASLVVGDAADNKRWWDGVSFDRILADVPCTASGIVRRHVDIKWLRREADIISFAAQQALILQGLWQLLAKGGKLLYATCSIFHEENQRQLDNFLALHADAAQLPLMHTQHEQLQRGQLHPSAEHDGFFYALLQKN
jgi:16S rRNA (cytosine967-C5)-methyltransferase